MQKDLEKQGFAVWDDGAYLHSKYVGEGYEWIIEKVYGSHKSGRQVYQ